MKDYQYAVIQLAGEYFYLLPQKAVYRPALRQLILSDLHLGKVSHFREQGIALPINSYQKDFEKLNSLVHRWNPHSVLFLGDLFHSTYNREWLIFKSLLMEYQSVKFVLVEGNHDILPAHDYNIPNLFKTQIIDEGNFIFSHHPLNQQTGINFCGHLHPGLQLIGMARQSVKLPCFYFNGRTFILPAFGELTGLSILEQERGSEYYVIANGNVIKV